MTVFMASRPWRSLRAPSPWKRQSPANLHTVASAPMPPPESYNHKAHLQAASLQVVRERYPELEDLVLRGDLLVVPRPADYQERREDGYEEPLEVFVLGTAHLSRQSARDAQRLIHAVRPDSVVVELCRSRSGLMYTGSPSDGGSDTISGGSGGDGPLEGGAASSVAGSSSLPSGGLAPTAAGARQVPTADAGGNPLMHLLELEAGTRRQGTNLMNLSGPRLLPAFQRSLELGGRSALVLRLLLGALSSRVGGGNSAGNGLEFVAARVAGEAVGAQIVLGDRPIEITLRRAWQALSWRRRLQLAGQLLQGAMVQGQVQLDEAAIERLKEDDTLSLIFSQLAAEYPEVMAPLIHERDRYLAWSLKRSKAVNGATRVVGLVGKGHLRGVCYALTSDSSALRFRDLVGGSRRASRGQQLLRQVAVEAAALAAFLWAWSSFFPE